MSPSLSLDACSDCTGLHQPEQASEQAQTNFFPKTIREGGQSKGEVGKEGGKDAVDVRDPLIERNIKV